MGPIDVRVGTAVTDAYFNTRNSLAATAGLWNRQLASNWLRYFQDTFMVELRGALIPADSKPHDPPASWVVTGQAENETDIVAADIEALGIGQSGPPVCAVPVYAAPVFVPSAVPPKLTTQNATSMPVPAGDRMPNGYIATAPDGSRWQKIESATPFGSVELYVRIS